MMLQALLLLLFILATASLLTSSSSSWCQALSPLVDGRNSNKKKTFHGGHDHTKLFVPRRRRRRRISTTTNAADASFTQHLYMVEEGMTPSNEPQQQHASQKSLTKLQQWTEYYITPELEVPTTTEQEPMHAGLIPPRPKIVVFGASGRIGRRIVKKLLSSGVDIDVVAFVRDAKKLERVLYNDEDLVLENLVVQGTGNKDKIGHAMDQGSNNGPRLQVMVADLVSRRDVYGHSFETEREKETLDAWVNRAKNFFATKGWNYYNATNSDLKTENDINILESGGEEALRDAIVGATVIISCLGTFRPSDVWTDYLRVPILRIFRRDVSKWCSDPTHPYYVNFLTTKKILDEAEKEQQRRMAALEFEYERMMLEEQLRKGREQLLLGKEEEGFESSIASGLKKKRNDGVSDHRRQANTCIFGSEGATILPKNGRLPSSHDRIKFIRISHAMVGQSPFRVRNCLANIFWSQLSRFELMGEMLMETSKLVDTIVLRPGELTDDERNANQTSLQLRIDGKVPSPSLVGRDDLADLAVVAALTSTPSTLDNANRNDFMISGGAKLSQNQYANHFTWAIRWTGQYLSPPQGLRPDGLSNAALCFADAVQGELIHGVRQSGNRKRIMSYVGGREIIRLYSWTRRLMKPYVQSLAISIPVYTVLGVFIWLLFGKTAMTTFWKLRFALVSVF